MSDVGKFIGLLLTSREQAHVFHLLTSSYAVHKSTEKYYSDIVDLVDNYAETYMGKYRKKLTGIGPYVNRTIKTDPRYTRIYFMKLLKVIRGLRLPRDTTLNNIRDEIDELIMKTIYSLTLR